MIAGPLGAGRFLNTRGSTVFPPLEAVAMERAELLENLDTYGRRLASAQAGPDDVMKALGLALIALRLLIDTPSITDTPPPNHATSFKAKSNRW